MRTNGRRTLRLAQSLNDAGIEAWTPRAVHKQRLSKIHVGFREVEQPIMPSFVFARARHKGDLLAILSTPSNPHPQFSIFQHDGRAPVISDASLNHLRETEDRGKRARRKARRHAVAVGTEVKPSEGAFAGLTGVVEMVKGKEAIVHFGGNIRFNVATWLLVDDQVEAA